MPFLQVSFVFKVESNVGSEEDSNVSDGEIKSEPKETPLAQNSGRSSRRKPAAPQWVNPEWQDEKEKQSSGNEVIINGVCVMQTEDYGRRSAEETVRVEPTPVMDRFDDDEDDQSDSSSVSHENQQPAEQTEDKEAPEDEKKREEEDAVQTNEEDESGTTPHKREDEVERWDY